MNATDFSSNLLDIISVGICIVDREYNVQFWNDYMEEYTGVKKNDIHEKPLYEYFPTFKKEIYRERIDSIFEGWPPVILSSRLHKPFFFSVDEEHKKRFQELTISPYAILESDSFWAVFTITDVTDLTNKLKEQNELYKKSQNEIEARIKTQEKLKVSEKSLQELNATKDKFFSIIAHDLRGPFNALLGLSELLVEKSIDRDADQVVEVSRHINESSKNTYSLLVNLLDWSRLQLGKFTFKPEKVDINTIIDDILNLHISAAKGKKIVLKKDIQPNILLYADMNMISTIIRNLISNSIKFTPAKGEVTIKVFTHKTELRFSIIDTGIGIKKEDIHKLFKIDSKFSRTGTASETGTGLGLILCKEFVENHDGKIWVESEFGKGSVFSFSIPTNINTT